MAICKSVPGLYPGLIPAPPVDKQTPLLINITSLNFMREKARSIFKGRLSTSIRKPCVKPWPWAIPTLHKKDSYNFCHDKKMRKMVLIIGLEEL